MTPERLIGMCNAKSINPQNIGLGGPPEWKASDAALACKGLSREATAAFRYRWARDDSVWPVLYRYLLHHANRLAADEQWHPTVLSVKTGERTGYLDGLVRLALLEEHHGQLMQLAAVWPDLMCVTPGTWARKLSPRYEAVRLFLTIWCGEAHHHIRRQLQADY